MALPITSHTLVGSLLRQLSTTFRSPTFRESFAAEVVQPLAHSAFGVSLRHAAYLAISLVACVVLLLLLLCLLLGLAFARLGEVVSACSELKCQVAALSAGS